MPTRPRRRAQAGEKQTVAESVLTLLRLKEPPALPAVQQAAPPPSDMDDEAPLA